MNMAMNQYQDQEFDYNVDERRDSKEKTPQKKRLHYARANRPVVHNGIHRRRNKRFSW